MRPSPFAAKKRGTPSLSVESGQLEGRVGELVLTAEDKDLQVGSVGVWAYDAGRPRFDNITVGGVLVPGWIERALKKGGLSDQRDDCPRVPRAQDKIFAYFCIFGLDRRRRSRYIQAWQAGAAIEPSAFS